MVKQDLCGKHFESGGTMMPQSYICNDVKDHEPPCRYISPTPSKLITRARDFVRATLDCAPSRENDLITELTKLLYSVESETRETCARVCDKFSKARDELRIGAIRVGDRDSSNMHAAKSSEAQRCAVEIRKLSST